MFLHFAPYTLFLIIVKKKRLHCPCPLYIDITTITTTTILNYTAWIPETNMICITCRYLCFVCVRVMWPINWFIKHVPFTSQVFISIIQITYFQWVHWWRKPYTWSFIHVITVIYFLLFSLSLSLSISFQFQ